MGGNKEKFNFECEKGYKPSKSKDNNMCQVTGCNCPNFSFERIVKGMGQICGNSDGNGQGKTCDHKSEYHGICIIK